MFPATNPAPSIAQALPYRLPDDENARLALFVIRRMGAFGLADAQAAHAMVVAFGQQFRRPLVLLRTVMAEIAATASGSITIAPGCCCRMTRAEAAVLEALARAETEPEAARLMLGDLLGNRRVDGVLASVGAVAAAFADAGRPIARCG